MRLYSKPIFFDCKDISARPTNSVCGRSWWVTLKVDDEDALSFRPPDSLSDNANEQRLWCEALAEQLNGGPARMTEEELLRGLDGLTAPKQEAAE